jgi:hypothetical protein
LINQSGFLCFVFVVRDKFEVCEDWFGGFLSKRVGHDRLNLVGFENLKVLLHFLWLKFVEV